MSMGVRPRSVRVGVAPSRSSSEGRINGNDHDDEEEDVLISSDDEQRGSTFLKIPVKNAELKEKLLARRSSNPGTGAPPVLHSQRKKLEQRERRRSSVLQSLAMLDVTGEDKDINVNIDMNRSIDEDEDHDHDQGRNSSDKIDIASLQTFQTSGRYLRTESITKPRVQPDVDGVQSAPLATRIPQEDIDYGYSSDSYGYDGGTSNSHDVGKDRRRFSSMSTPSAAPPLTSKSAPTRSRYLRRGSVTRHKIQAEVSSMQPTAHHNDDANDDDYGSDMDYGYNDDNDNDNASVVSMPPLSSSASFSTDSLPPRQRYPRRGSVTKFSLDHHLQKHSNDTGALQGDKHKKTKSNVDYGYNDDNDNDNASVVSMPALSSSASLTTPRQRYLRRGSVTKFSLDHHLQKHSNDTGALQGDNHKKTNSDVDYGYNDDNDNASVVSMPPLSSSASFSTNPLPPRQRYLRRGSVTKFSLDHHLQKHSNDTGALQGDNHKKTNSDVDYGYNDDNDNDNASVVSMPPLSSSAAFSSDSLPPRQRYPRRGSVTKFSLDQCDRTANSRGDLQPDQDKIAHKTRPLTTAAMAAQSSDSDSDTESKPKPGDDDYSDNLENSGRFSKRSISISLDGEDFQPPLSADSKRPPLPRAHSTSSTMQHKPKTRHTTPKHSKNELEDDSNHIKKRMASNQGFPSQLTNNLKTTLEVDSGHVQKSSKSQKSALRRDSASSLDSENSDAEFGSEMVESQPKARSPPKLPPSTLKIDGPIPPKSVSSTKKKALSNIKTTIDGHIANMSSSSSFDDLSSHTNVSDDEEGNISIQSVDSKKGRLRARRCSIVGIPSSDSGYSSLDDCSSHADEDTPQKIKMRGRRASIVGIPTIDPVSPSSDTPDTEGEHLTNSKLPSSSENEETTKPKKKLSSKTKTTTKTKKTSATRQKPKTEANTGTISSTLIGRRGCMKADDSPRMPKKVRFGHLVITEFPIILGE